MKLSVVAIGQRLPAWAEEACADYLKRFPPDWKVELKALKAESRESKPVPVVMSTEAARIDAAIGPGCRRIVLDERGARLSSAELAQRFQVWQMDGRPLAFVIGGADGLDPGFKASADEAIRLSDLTLPHAMARVLLLEQIYRAWSLLHNHPYHRA